MVRGLNVFRERFAGFQDRYVLIGGAAVEVAMNAAALPFRVTRDLDVVLHVESLDAEFARVFWAFVTEGGYEWRERSTGKPTLYRFSRPSDERFPSMIELFSRRPELIEPPENCHLTPLPIADEVSSLSAILLGEDYYDFVLEGARVRDGLSVLAAEHIVPLKARAWVLGSIATTSSGSASSFRRQNGSHSPIRYVRTWCSSWRGRCMKERSPRSSGSSA